MLHTPLTQTLPVGLADAYASMRLEVGSAYTLIFFFKIIPLLIGRQWVPRHHARKSVYEVQTTSRFHSPAQMPKSFAMARAPCSLWTGNSSR